MDGAMLRRMPDKRSVADMVAYAIERRGVEFGE